MQEQNSYFLSKGIETEFLLFWNWKSISYKTYLRYAPAEYHIWVEQVEVVDNSSMGVPTGSTSYLGDKSYWVTLVHHYTGLR